MVAFEPHPENYGVTVQALLGALPQTDLHCIQIYAAALGAESGQGLLFGDGAAASFFRQNADIYAARSTQGQAHARRHGGMLEYGEGDLPPHLDVAESGRAGGRAELLAKWQHTDRLQNPAKLRRFRIGGRIGGGIGAG